MNILDVLCNVLGCNDYIDLIFVLYVCLIIAYCIISLIYIRSYKTLQKGMIYILSVTLDLLSTIWTFFVKKALKRRKQGKLRVRQVVFMSSGKIEITKEMMLLWNQEIETYKTSKRRDEYFIFNNGGMNHESFYSISSI